MEAWTEVVSERVCATWVQQGGSYFVVSAPMGDHTSAECRDELTYLEQCRWNRQLRSDLETIEDLYAFDPQWCEFA